MVVVVMGVTGTGKSTVGKRLASSMVLPFIEGDDFHDPANVEKMRRGVPLTEEDRGPWLDKLRTEILRHESGAVLACSALTAAFRHRLVSGVEGVRFVLLRADVGLLRERLEARKGHFAGVDLLDSQLNLLEEPDDAVTVDVDAPEDDIVRRIRTELLGEGAGSG